MIPFQALSSVLFLFASLLLFLAFRARSQILTLDHFITLPDEELPGLSIVIAARDEAKTLGPALTSLLNLDYPDLEIVFVDDRSRDQTQEIALAQKQRHPRGERLKVLHCEELPEGWLGKVHALHLGAKASTRELILLSDADVVFEPGSLKRALSAQRVLDCHHLVVAPHMETKGFWEPVLVAFFLLMFTVRFQPGKVHLRKDRYVGMGAFNLLTRATLEDCGYLEPLRLQVIEDVHLGRLVKSQGKRQYCVLGQELIKVKWFEGLRGCVKGLEKNSYAGLNYDLSFALAAIPMVALPFWLPITLFALGLHSWALGLLCFFFLAGITIPASCRLPRWVGLAFPLAALVLAFTFARSVWLTERQQGVIWRDTHYGLEELRRAHHHFVNEVAVIA